MRTGLTQLIIISAYLLLLVLLGVCANRMFRGTKKDYLLASHSIGPFLLLMSVFGTTMTAFALVGSTGKAFERVLEARPGLSIIHGLRAIENQCDRVFTLPQPVCCQCGLQEDPDDQGHHAELQGADPRQLQ